VGRHFHIALQCAALADRAPVPLSVPADVLHAARARVKKDKFRTITLAPPLADKLASAVQLGIWDSIKLYTEGPPKGSKNSFGLRAYEWWAEQLTNPRARLAWEKVFPPGRKMLAGLASAYHDILHFGKRYDPADRGKFADFLDEAAVILNRSALTAAADHFRQAAESWQALALTLLPDDVAPFREYRQLSERSQALFAHQGAAATEARRQIAAEQEALLAAMEADFPLDGSAVQAMRERIAAQVLTVRDIEAQAVTALKAAMA